MRLNVFEVFVHPRGITRLNSNKTRPLNILTGIFAFESSWRRYEDI